MFARRHAFLFSVHFLLIHGFIIIFFNKSKMFLFLINFHSTEILNNSWLNKFYMQNGLRWFYDSQTFCIPLHTIAHHRTPSNPTQSIARKVHNFNIRNRHLTVTHRSSVKLLLPTCPTATYVHNVYAGHICRIIPSHIINFAANFCTLSCQTRCTRYLLLLS